MGKKKNEKNTEVTKEKLDVFNRPTKRETIPMTYFGFLQITVLSNACLKKSKFLIPTFPIVQNPDGSFVVSLKEIEYLRYKDVKYIDISLKDMSKSTLNCIKTMIINKVFSKKKPRKMKIISKVKHPDERNSGWLYDVVIRIPHNIFSLLVIDDASHINPLKIDSPQVHISKLNALIASASTSRYAISLLDKNKNCICYAMTTKTKLDE